MPRTLPSFKLRFPQFRIRSLTRIQAGKRSIETCTWILFLFKKTKTKKPAQVITEIELNLDLGVTNEFQCSRHPYFNHQVTNCKAENSVLGS